jgi:hypothetical protein
MSLGATRGDIFSRYAHAHGKNRVFLVGMRIIRI